MSTIEMAEYPIIENTKFEPDDEYIPVPEPEPGPPAWMDGSLRIGIHTSISGSYLNALESARKLGANALQIFSASPRMWQLANVKIPEMDAKAFRARREELGLGPLVIHANYLINLAAGQPMLRTRSIQAFHEELVRGRDLGADFVVVHPGSRGEMGIEQAISTIVESVKAAARRVPLGKMRVLIENTAGMGTAVGSRLEEVAAILYGLNRAGRSEGRSLLGDADGRPLQFGACLDTAHLFAAGYDIKSEAGLERTIEEIDRILGLENVPVFHANDSKIPLGGRVDRHENIGRGKIGPDAFERMLKHSRLGSAAPEGLPGRAFLLETPIDHPGDDRKNVAKLWELAGVEGPAGEKGFSMLTTAMKKMMERKGKRASSRHLPAAKRKKK
ncbi:MAG TPA: deoxyribonuclease IV [Candidatus Eisenbacteria bacterium]|nr:deoxyribonuclease IV [Candidatus Eisenbacteria bacterium]